MTWFKKNLIFTVLMVLLAGALGYEIFLTLGKRSTALAAEADFRKKVEEFQQLANSSVLPHVKNVEMTEAEIERQKEELALYIASMQDQAGLAEKFAKHPTSPTNALFDIQFFVDEYRQKAANATLLTAADLEDEYFGFAAYSQAGPEESLIPTVYKQRLIVAYILDRLFEARPEALISVRRPGEARAEADQAENRGGRGRPDQASGSPFRLNPQLTAAIPDIVKTSAFEVVFTGRASTLRTFLNELAEFDMPLLVRSVQVVSASDDQGRDQGQSTRRRRSRAPAPASETQQEEAEGEASKKDENIPLVANNLSRFTVALEFIDLIPLENAR